MAEKAQTKERKFWKDVIVITFLGALALAGFDALTDK